jgi:hypothetical protein
MRFDGRWVLSWNTDSGGEFLPNDAAIILQASTVKLARAGITVRNAELRWGAVTSPCYATLYLSDGDILQHSGASPRTVSLEMLSRIFKWIEAPDDLHRD